MTLMTMFCRTTVALMCSAVLVLGAMSTIQPVHGQSRGGASSRPPAANGPVAQAAYQDNSWSIPGSDSGSASATTDPEDPTTAGGYGVIGRLGHITGPAVGHKESFSFLEVAPYTTYEENWLSGDFRVLRTNRGFHAMSGGVVARHFVPAWNAILGANAFFDSDETRRGTRFQQGGFGVELLTENLDVRSNFYYPSGTNTAVTRTGIVANSSRFADNRILFDGFRDTSTAAGGVDMLFTVPVPGRIAESINLETSAGWYHFGASDDQVEKLTGWKLRVDTSFSERLLHMFGEFTEDGVFGKNIIVGADINYWHKTKRGPRLGTNQYNRIAQWVERNWTVTTVDQRLIDAGLVATNPTTGNAYFVEHVNTNVAGVGTGTFEDPYMAITSAFANAPDPSPDNLIFVHGGSQFNAPIVLNPLDRVFGEGITHTLAVNGFSAPLILPSATGGPRPLITGIVGNNAVTMADGSTFAGFVIDNVQNGNAIQIDSINGATVRGVDISNITGVAGTSGRGISILNSTGTINLFDMNIATTNQESLYVTGGTANITLGTSNSSNPLSSIIASAANARAVHIDGAGGSVNMVRSTISTAAGATTRGVLVNNFSTATTNFGGISLTGGTIDFLNIRGATSVNGDVLIDAPVANPENANGVAINIFDADARVGFGGTVDITNRPATAILVNDTTNAVVFSQLVDIGLHNGAPVGAHAVDYVLSSGDLIFNGSINIANSPGAGINVGANNLAGSDFRITGPFAISQTADSAIRVLGGPTVGVLNGGTISARGQRGIELFGTSGTWTFNGSTDIDNLANSVLPAVDIQQVNAGISFNTVNIVNSRAGAGTAGFFVSDNRDNNIGLAAALRNPRIPLQVTQLNVLSQQSEAVRIQGIGSTIIGNGTLIANGGRALTIQNNDTMNVTFDSITSLNSPNVGILVDNTPGLFQHLGILRQGVISNAALAGAVFNFVDSNTQDTDQIINVGFGTGSSVSLNNMDINANGDIGILADRLDTLQMTNMLIRNNQHEGVFLGDVFAPIGGGGVLNVLIEDSTFTGNGADATAFGNGRREHFEAQIGFPGITDPLGNLITTQTYTYRFYRNVVTDVGFTRVDDDAFRIATVAGGERAILDLEVGDATTGVGRQIFTVNRDPVLTTASAFRVEWAGQIARAVIQNNTWNLRGGTDQVGMDIQTLPFGRTNFSANVTYDGNQVFGTGNAANAGAAARTVGANFDFAGPATLIVRNNRILTPSVTDPTVFVETPGMTFTGDQSRAIQMSFNSPGNTVTLADNNMRFNADNGVAFFVPINSGATNFTIDRNTVDHVDTFINFALPERFFDAQTVTGSMTFQGTDDNIFTVLNGRAQPFLNTAAFPPGLFSGTFFINSQPFP